MTARPLRIGVGGFLQETTLRSLVPTGPENVTVSRGAAIFDIDNWPAVHGVVARLREESDVEIVPLLFARAASGGPVEKRFYESIRDELTELIAALATPLDGMALINHGALEVEGYAVHGDTDFALAVRRAVGRAQIGIPFDMHGQVTPELLCAIDALTVLRTAPHRDIHDIGYRMAGHLLDVVRGCTRPSKAAVHIPMFIPGEKAMTAYSPARELFGALAEYDKRPGVIEADIFIGFGWSDRPWIGMKSVVVSDDDPALARATAIELAEAVWARRHDFQLRMEHHPVAGGLAAAAASTAWPTYVSDSGDNVTAGAGGDLTDVLQTALDMPGLDDPVVLGIFAPDTVRLCREAGVGATVAIDLGSEHVTAPRRLRRVMVTVEAEGDAIRPPGIDRLNPNLSISAGAWVRVRIGSALVTFHAVHSYIGAPALLRAMGIDPVSHKVYIVKFGYLLPQTEDVAARHILLVSGGAADMAFDRLSWHQIARPAFPMDPDMEWSATDAVFTDTIAVSSDTTG